MRCKLVSLSPARTFPQTQRQRVEPFVREAREQRRVHAQLFLSRARRAWIYVWCANSILFTTTERSRLSISLPLSTRERESIMHCTRSLVDTDSQATAHLCVSPVSVCILQSRRIMARQYYSIFTLSLSLFFFYALFRKGETQRLRYIYKRRGRE